MSTGKIVFVLPFQEADYIIKEGRGQCVCLSSQEVTKLSERGCELLANTRWKGERESDSESADVQGGSTL